MRADDTSDGPWPGIRQRLRRAETRPQPIMARLFRASCLLSLLLAGFIPPSQGQEKSKVSEPRGWGARGKNTARRCHHLSVRASL